jgi:hypothetical protein
MCDGEEKKLVFRALRKRRHQKRAKEKETKKWSKICKKRKKKKKERKKEHADRPFPLIFSSAQETHKEREREKAL